MHCVLIKSQDGRRSKQGLTSFEGVSRQSAGAKGLCLHVVEIPPLGRAKPHLHRGHDSAVYVLSGEAGMWYGDGLAEHMRMAAGDFIYIPPNVPHLPHNASETVSCIGVVARTDPNEQESVTLLSIADPGIPG